MMLLQTRTLIQEGYIGCNHKCLFCGYTFHRTQKRKGTFAYKNVGSKNNEEHAIIEILKNKNINLQHLRNTAIDGSSQRLRFNVNKKITNDMLNEFFMKLFEIKQKAIKLYNLVGLPTETDDDYNEIVNVFINADKKTKKTEKKIWIQLHNTPFKPLPLTPLANTEIKYKDYRNVFTNLFNRRPIYEGKTGILMETLYCESLPTHTTDIIIHRATEQDAQNIRKIATSNKFLNATAQQKKEILEKLFDVKKLFGNYNADNLPTKYLRTYCKVEKIWRKNDK